MAQLRKTVDQPLTEDLLRSLTKEFVHVTINEHTIKDPLNDTEKVENVWFAGMVAGFERLEIYFDWIKEEFRDEPEIAYNLLLADGSGWLLSKTKLEIYTLTEEEFKDLVAKEAAKQAKNKLYIPPVQGKIIVPELGVK